MSEVATDGDFSTPWLESKLPFRPISNRDDLGYRLTFVQNVDDFTPASMNDQDLTNLTGDFYLTAESDPEEVGNGLVRFVQEFTVIPQTWTDYIDVSFTYPGISQGSGTRWKRYGWRKPQTHSVRASVEHVYGDYATLAALAATEGKTVPMLQGEPVDFFGAAYDEEGDFLGLTNPLSEPVTYVHEVSVTRWRGEIWVKRKTTVPWAASIIF